MLGENSRKGTICEVEIIVQLGDDHGDLHKSCKVIGKTIRNINEVQGSVPREMMRR